MVDNKIIQDAREEEETEAKILTLLTSAIDGKDRKTLRDLIEKLIDLQEKRIYRKGQRESGYFYWSGKSDVWDKIFQALMGK